MALLSKIVIAFLAVLPATIAALQAPIAARQAGPSFTRLDKNDAVPTLPWP